MARACLAKIEAAGVVVVLQPNRRSAEKNFTGLVDPIEDEEHVLKRAAEIIERPGKTDG